MTIDQDVAVVHDLTREKYESVLVDLQESIQFYIEALTGLPVQIIVEGIMKRESIYQTISGVAEVPLPHHIILAENAEQNRQAYTSLATLAAAKILYSQGFDTATLTKIVNEAHDTLYYDAYDKALERLTKEQQRTPTPKQIPRRRSPLAESIQPKSLEARAREEALQDIPISPVEVGTLFHITATGDSSRYSLTKHCKHPIIVEQLIEIVEQGRIMARFFNEYPAARPWVTKNFGYFYYEELRTVRERAMEEQKSIRSQLPLCSLISAERKLLLSTSALRYSCIFQTTNFLQAHLEERELLEQEERKILREIPTICRYDETPERERLQLHEEALNTSKHWFTIASKAFTPTATLHDSIRAALEIYIDMCKAMKQRKLPDVHSIRKYIDPARPGHQEDITDHINSVVSAYNLKDKETHESRGPRKEAFQQRQVYSAQLHPTYREWNCIANMYTENSCITVREESLPKPKDPTFPFPPLEKKILHSLTAQLQLLQPEGLVRVRNQARGRFDSRAYARFLARLNAGIPARPLYSYRDEHHERSATALLLIDLSDSTGQLINQQHTILDKLKEATLYFSQALTACGDPLAIYGVTSSTTLYKRERTSLFTKVKDFEEELSETTLRERLTTLEPLYNNRDGAFIRHGTTILSERPEETKLLLYLNDGAPHDKALEKYVDTTKPTDPPNIKDYKARKRRREEEQEYQGRYAWEDIARAVREAQEQAITPLIIRVNEHDEESISAMNAKGINYRRAHLNDMRSLVNAWAEAYTELTR